MDNRETFTNGNPTGYSGNPGKGYRQLHRPLSAGQGSVVSIAKITKPKIMGVLPRQRLFRLLDTCCKYPITWVSAPAGSGKTTLIASYLSHRKIPCIWYRVDEGDEDIATFFYYMGIAARKFAPLKKKTLPLLTSEYIYGIPAFTLRYFENLYSRLKPPFVIVFDNYQQTSVSSGFHEVLCKGLGILPEELRVIIMSRGNPHPHFAQLRVSGKLSFLGGDEMRFTLDESKKMIQMKRRRELSENALCRIYDRSRGWAAGLLLMSENSIENDFDHHDLVGHAPGEIFDYFATEIFGKVDEELREFLLQTAFLPGMTVSMAERLTGIPRSGEILYRLQREHFFTEKNTQSDPVYRYHPLFREFLLSRAKGMKAGKWLRRILQTSAVLLGESGLIEDAIELFAAAGEWEDMTGFILKHAPTLTAQGRNKTLEEWVRKIPEEILAGSPWLLYWMGASRMAENPVESRGQFEKAFMGFRERGDYSGEMLAWSGAVDSILFAWDDFRMLDTWIDWLDSRITEGRSFPSPEVEARVASSMAGALTWRLLYRTDTKKWLEQALLMSRQTGDINLQLNTMHHAIAYSIFAGDFNSLPFWVMQAKEIARSPDASPFSLLLWKAAEPVLKEISPLSYGDVIADVKNSLEMADNTGIHFFDFWLLVHGVCGSILIQDMRMAGRFLRDMDALVKNGPRQPSGQYYLLSALHHYLSGDNLKALELAENALNIFLEIGTAPLLLPCRYLIVDILHKRGERDKALAEFSTVKELAANLGEEEFFSYRCLQTEAAFMLEQGEEKTGLELLKRSMELGRKRNYMTMMFCWDRSFMAGLCASALEAGLEQDYAKDFIRSYNLFPDEPPIEVEQWPWPVKLFTLGRFELLLDGVPKCFKGKVQRKPLLLLKALISLGGRDVKEEQVTDLLWPEADGDQAHSALTTTVLRLRRFIGHDAAIEVRQGKLSLNPRYWWLDLWAFEKMYEQAEPLTREKAGPGSDEAISCEKTMKTMVKACHAYHGPFLPDEGNSSWVMTVRDRLLRKYTRLVIGLCDRLESDGQWEKAAEYYSTALDRDTITDEEIYQRLMLCYRHLGRTARAIEVYQRCRKTLAWTLCIKPSQKTEAIYRQFLE